MESLKRALSGKGAHFEQCIQAIRFLILMNPKMKPVTRAFHHLTFLLLAMNFTIIGLDQRPEKGIQKSDKVAMSKVEILLTAWCSLFVIALAFGNDDEN